MAHRHYLIYRRIAIAVFVTAMVARRWAVAEVTVGAEIFQHMHSDSVLRTECHQTHLMVFTTKNKIRYSLIAYATRLI